MNISKDEAENVADAIVNELPRLSQQIGCAGYMGEVSLRELILRHLLPPPKLEWVYCQDKRLGSQWKSQHGDYEINIDCKGKFFVCIPGQETPHYDTWLQAAAAAQAHAEAAK